MAEDLDLVCGFLTSFAQEYLTKKGDFDSFGVVLDEEGKLTMVAGVLPPEYDSTEKIVRFWFGALRQTAAGKNYRAVGFWCNLLLTNQTTGEKLQSVSVWLEHSDGRAEAVRFPCEKDSVKRISLGKPSSKPQEPRVFNQQTA
jgi:hypothetical protein